MNTTHEIWKQFKDQLRHYLNPLHIYCRLRPCFGKQLAMTMANKYETTVYRRILA